MNEITHYTAEEIHMDMTLQAVEYMKQYIHSATDPKVEERARKLKAVGLTNSKTFAETHRSACFSFFRRNFPGCIFLSEETFIRLLQKYNLKCGTLDHNIGDENVFSNTLGSDVKVEIIKLLTVMARNDFIQSRYGGFFADRNAGMTVRELLNDNLGLVETMPFLHIRNRFNVLNDVKTESRTLERNELLIAAPAQEMKEVYTESIEHVRSEDPFVFQFTPYGVVIFSKWGEEAEDETLSNERIW